MRIAIAGAGGIGGVVGGVAIKKWIRYNFG